MPFASAISQHPDAAVATAEVTGAVLEDAGPRPDLAVAFVSGAHVGAVAEIAATIQTLLEPSCFVGAGALGVICGSEGVEGSAAISLWAGTIGGAVTPVHLDPRPAAEGVVVMGLPAAAAASASTLLMLADPLSFPVGEFLEQLGADHPHLAAIGGLASAADSRAATPLPGSAASTVANPLIIGGRIVGHGAVGVLLDAAASPRTIVSQGCRPIGEPWVVTRAEGNVIFELGGRPAFERVLATVEQLEPAERELAALGLHCGIVADERKLVYERGDFLVRSVLGADRGAGAVAVGDLVEVGATVQFHVRDAGTASEDLHHLVGSHASARRPQGALLFTCVGRGAAMFGTADHDPEIVHGHLGTPLAGMFCAGEIGPVAGRNALHGFTASVALFDG